MKFYGKIFWSIFSTSFALGLALLIVTVSTASRDMRTEFIERYVTLSDLIGNTLIESESSIEKIGVNAAKHLDLLIRQKGIPETSELRALASDLKVTQFTITDHEGRFLRDTITDPKTQTHTLFDFCAGYRELLKGGTAVEATPIIPSSPYKGPFKFIMIPSHDRKYILETGMNLVDIGKILAETLRTDENIRSISLLSPTGFNFGTIHADGHFTDGEQHKISDLRPGLNELKGNTLSIVRRVKIASTQCCECKIKNVNDQEGYYYILKLEADAHPLNALIQRILMGAVALGIVLILLSAALAHSLARKLVQRLLLVESALNEVNRTGQLTQGIEVGGSDEVTSLAKNFGQMMKSLTEFREREVQMEKSAALAEQASQVAHDIRSPLAALNMVIDTLDSIMGEQKELIQNAIQRINDIANSLLFTGKHPSATQARSAAWMLLPWLESQISERRYQHRDLANVEILATLEEGHEISLDIDPLEFSRALSNLLNNAVESLHDQLKNGCKGSVSVRVFKRDKQTEIEIRDNGRGISPEDLKRLGQKGVTIGKEKGHGLGIYHARKTMEDAKGSLHIESELGKGTKVILMIPLVG